MKKYRATAALSFLAALIFLTLLIRQEFSYANFSGPWTSETMGALKKRELVIFFFIVFGLPLFSVLSAQYVFQNFSAPEVPPQLLEGLKGVSTTYHHLFFWIVLPLFLYLALVQPNIQGRLRERDEGLRLAAANQVLNGETSYKDIYFQYGPGTEVVQPLAAFRLFGDSLAAHRQLERILFPLGYLSLYFLALVLLKNRALLAVFILVILGHNSLQPTQRVALPFLAVLCILFSLRKSSPLSHRVKIVAAGGLCGLGLLYSLEGGLLIIPAIFLFILFSWLAEYRESGRLNNPFIKDGAWFCVGILGTLIPFFIFLGPERVPLFFRDTFFIGSTLLSAWGIPVPGVSLTAVSMRWWFPVFVYMMIITREFYFLLFKIRSNHRHLVLLTFVGIFFFVIAMGRSDPDHWRKATSIFWVVLFVILDLALIRWKWRLGTTIERWAAGLTIIILSLYTAHFFNFQKIQNRLTNINPLKLRFDYRTSSLHALRRLGSVHLTPQEREVTQKMVEKIWNYAPEGSTLFNFSESSIYYYLSDTINPTRYANIGFVVGEEMEKEVVDDLIKHPVSCVLARQSALRKDSRIYRNYNGTHNRIAEFLLENYEIVDRYNGYYFMVPQSTSTNVANPTY